MRGYFFPKPLEVSSAMILLAPLPQEWQNISFATSFSADILETLVYQ